MLHCLGIVLRFLAQPQRHQTAKPPFEVAKADSTRTTQKELLQPDVGVRGGQVVRAWYRCLLELY